jgi:hypothetical protein
LAALTAIHLFSAENGDICWGLHSPALESQLLIPFECPLLHRWGWIMRGSSVSWELYANKVILIDDHYLCGKFPQNIHADDSHQ